MSLKVIVALALLAALLLSGAASSSGPAAAGGEGAGAGSLRRLLAGREAARGSARRQEPAPQARPARVERRAHLSEDEREIMTKQIMHAISEVMNSECMSDRDYQGWVDFGRRDAD